MAQSGFTPILIYGSGTTGNTPAAGNLTTSASGVELALNYFDGKLFYKDNAGAVQVLAVKMPSGVLPIANGGTNATATPTAGAVAYGTGTAYAFTAVGTAGQPLLSNAGSAPAFGTLGVAGGGTGLTSLTANRIPYGAGTSAFANSANLTFDGSTLSVNSVNVGRGGGSVATNTAVGASALNANTTGQNIVAIGQGASANSTIGTNTTAVGQNALNSLGTGSDNTAIGVQALGSTTTGNQNTSVGSNSLFANSTGIRNVAVGYDAGRNTTASENTAIGWRSLYLTTSGGANTSLGSQALYSNTTASGNTAVGASALFTNSTGVENTAVGGLALYANTTGSYNTAVGGNSGSGIQYYAALRYNTTGSNNSAFGDGALAQNTTGNNNTALGAAAFYNVGGTPTTFSDGVAIGYRAGYANTAANNVFVGSQAALSNTTGTNGVAIGYQALNANTTANDNTAIGTSALLSNTGGNNVAVGSNALRSNTTANQGVAVGYRALYSNTTASNNIAIGNDAAFSNTTGGVVAIGFQSLYQNVTGTGNTAVGYGTLSNNGRSVTAGSFVVGISYTIQSIGTTDFTLIGAASNTVGVVFTATGVGTGTGTAASNTGFNTAVGYNAGANNTIGAVTAVGYEAALNNTSGSVTSLGYRAGRLNSTGTGNVAVGSNAGYTNSTGLNNTAIGDAANYGCTTGSGNTMVGNYAGYGNVGAASANTAIGTQALYIGGQTATVNNCTALGYASLNSAYGTTNTAVGYQSGSSITSGTKNTILGSYSGNQGGLDIRTASNYIVLSDGDGNPRQIIDGSGNILLKGAISTTGWPTGAVLISRLNASSYAGLVLSDPTGVSANNTQLSLTAWSGSGANYFSSRFTTLSNGDLTFSTQGTSSTDASGTSTERMRIDASGNVGIGTTPSYRLHTLSTTASTVGAYFHKNAGATPPTNGIAYFYGQTSTGVGTSSNGFITIAGSNGANSSSINIGVGQPATYGSHDTAFISLGNTASLWATANGGVKISTSGTTVGSGNNQYKGFEWYNNISDNQNAFWFWHAATAGSGNTFNIYSAKTANLTTSVLSVTSASGANFTIDNVGNSLNNSSTGGLGYGTGSGGAVTQATSRTTGVTLNKTNGAITLVSAAGTATWQSFTVTNSTVAATDTVIVNQKSGTDLYQIFVTNVAAGSFGISFATTGGTTTEQPVFNFAVIKAVTA